MINVRPVQVLRQAGVTLAEMLVVVAILALTASIAIPNAAPLATMSADAATLEVLIAIRFAQREAIRTGAWHTVKIDTATQTLRVYRLTSSGNEDTSNPVLHPIDQSKYDLALGGNGPARATIVLVDFDYQNGANTNLNTLGFRPDGTPAKLLSAKEGDFTALLKGQVSIKAGNRQRDLAIDIVTGRVSG